MQKVLYHATYAPLIYSIKRTGLGGGYRKNWPDSESGVVYLATDPHVALSYAETSDDVPEEWLDEIVVLRILTALIDPAKLSIDPNVRDNDGSTLIYRGVIPLRSIVFWPKVNK